MTRKILRYVLHTMRRVPGTATTVTAHCLAVACSWEHLPATSARKCEEACMAHTGRTNHMLFARTYAEVVVVERVQ